MAKTKFKTTSDVKALGTLNRIGNIFRHLAKLAGVTETTIRLWFRKFDEHGIGGDGISILQAEWLALELDRFEGNSKLIRKMRTQIKQYNKAVEKNG